MIAHQSRARVLVGVGALAACTGAPASAPPTSPKSEWHDENKVTTYEIHGSTAKELRDELDRLRPRDANGQPSDGVTKWDVKWQWDGGADDCDLSTARVTYKLEVVLPVWSPSATAPAELVTRWKSYREHLVAHEQRHVDNFLVSYPKVLKAMRAATCATANSQGDAALAAIRKFDTEYDAETGHGRTEGAVFP